MKILIVKMSSMGDIFHTFPSISDLKAHHPDAEIHWLVEESFAEIAAWHPAVNKIIPVALRRWMKNKGFTSFKAYREWRKALREETYDIIIDAQGLLKSGILAKSAKGTLHGYDKQSAREPINCWFQDISHFVEKNQHAVNRTRLLFAKTFNYALNSKLNFGIQEHFAHVQKRSNQLVFVIGTSWSTKLWSEDGWIALAKIALEKGFAVEIIWGSDDEKALAQRIIDACPNATRPQERMSITAVAEKLVAAAGVVGLDTGFAHLAGALEIPTLSIYGPTSPDKVGLIGDHTCNFQLTPALACMPCHKRYCKLLPEHSQDTPPCMNQITANHVWEQLERKLFNPHITF